MKKIVKIMLAVMLVMTMLIPTLAVNAATPTQNKGYVLVTEDFSLVTDHRLVTETRDADDNKEVDTAWTGSTSYQIGDSDWVFRTNSNKDYFANSANINASVTEDGKLSLTAGGAGDFHFIASSKSAMNRVPAVLYDGDYSKVGDNFKISFDFTKSVNLGACIKFMVNNGIASYYALNLESGAGNALWNLYKVTDNEEPTVLVSAPETIAVSGSYNDCINSGSVTVVYDNGKISWEIEGTRYNLGAYSHTGTYTDAEPFGAAPSECTFGFSTNKGNQKLSVDNIKFSYSVPDISEDFSDENISTSTFANAEGVNGVRTNITGTDLYVTTKANSNAGRLNATVTDGALKILYGNANMFSLDQINKLDFVEYRGDGYTGVGDNYTITFDYSTGQGRNSGYFIFGLPANEADDYTYNEYYVLAFTGQYELSLYVNNGEATAEKPVPTWEIRKMNTDTWSDTIVKSDNTFVYDSNVTLRNTINANSIKKASVTLTVKDGVASITVDADRGTNPETKTFNVGKMAGNHFAFSNGSLENATGSYDNIVLTADKASVEPIGDKVYVYSGKFAQKNGVLLFEVTDGNNVSYSSAPVTMDTHEQASADIPANATKVFFWNNFTNIYPLNESINITQ